MQRIRFCFAGLLVLAAPTLALAQPATQPSAEPEVAAPAPAPEPPKAAPPAVTAKYDNGLTFDSADGNFEMKLYLRGQVRLDVGKTDVDDSEFIDRFQIIRA